MPENKFCRTCGTTKSTKDFYKHKLHRDGLSSNCKKCVKEQNARYRNANRNQLKEYWKHRRSMQVKFDTYKDRLDVVETIRRHPARKVILQVRCTYCDKWYSPTDQDVQNRVKALEGTLEGECRLYCSDGCKLACSVYHQKLYPKGHSRALDEVSRQLRRLVFKRDAWQCVLCESEENLHCHHITGTRQNPLESADVDNCITVCMTCHIYIHSQRGCTYYDLMCKPEVGSHA